MPKVSIILSSYNHAKFVCESIENTLNQTFADFELIIWDDCSSDNSWELIQRYNDPRIKAFRNEKNMGGVYGVNKAISEIAIGEYIAIHHSDDVWELDKLQKQVDYLAANPQVGAVFTNAQPIDERGLPLADKSHFYYNVFNQANRSRQEWLRHFFCRGNALCHPSILIRKQCYKDCGQYLDLLAQLTDFDMWVRLCLKYEIHVLPDRLVKFRVRDAEMNQSGSRPETRIRFRTEFHCIRKHFLSIETFDELASIFPEAEKYRCSNGFEPKFIIAMMAISIESQLWTRLLGIELLFDLLADPGMKERIESIYQFSHRDFVEITGKNDVFSLETVNAQKYEIAKRDVIISGQAEQIQRLTQSPHATSFDAYVTTSLKDAQNSLDVDRQAYEKASHLIESGQVNEGRRMLAALAEKASTCWEVYNDIAVQHFNEGDYEQAELYFKRGVAIEGAAGTTAGNFAMMLLAKGDVEGALAVLGGILHERPHDGAVLTTIREVLSNINPIPPGAWQRLVSDLRDGRSLGNQGASN